MSLCGIESSAALWVEPDRLAALRGFDILDTEPETMFDSLTKVAAHVCDAPIALISLIDEQRQWFKCEIGLKGVRETPREIAICAHAILQSGMFVVPDARKDPRFSSNPLVTGEPHLRFYAGAPLITEEGLPLGTLCVFDNKARPEGLTPVQTEALLALANAVMSQLKLRQVSKISAEAEKRFRTIAEAMPQMVWSTRPDGNPDYQNSRWYEFTGLPVGSTYGDAWKSLLHPDDQERAWSQWQCSLETGEPFETEYRLRHHSGEYRWALVRALPISDGEGRIERWFGTCTDIHDWKQSVSASEHRYRALVEASATLVWRARPDGTIIDGSAEWEDFTGQNADDFKGTGWLAVVHPEDRERVIAVWQNILEAAQPGTNEFRVRQANGAYRWFITRTVPIKNAEGVVQEWVGTITNIHDHKMAAERIRISEGRYRALIETNDSIVWLATPDGFMRGEMGWTATSDQSSEERAGDGWLDVVHPEDRDRVRAISKQAVSSAIPWEAEFRVQHKNGHCRWSLTKGVPLKDDTGIVREWVGTQTDIHDRKQAQESLRASEERLRLAAEATSLGIWDIDLITGERQWTPEARTILGLAADAPITPETFLPCVHPEDRDRVGKWFTRRSPNGARTYQDIFRILGPGINEERWIAAHGRDILDENGQPIRKIGTVQDITERKRAEAALAEKAALLEATLENMDQGLIMADAADKVIVFNRRALDLLDLPLELLAKGPSVHEIKAFQTQMGDIAPDDDEVLKLAQTGGFLSDPNSYERTRTNGTVLEIRTVPLSDGGAVRTYTDITARRQAEGALRASEERLWLAFQAGRMFAWEQDLTTNYVTRSRHTVEWLGIGSGPLSAFLERFHPEDRHLRQTFLDQILATGSGTMEFRYVLPDGQTLWLGCRGERAGPNRVVGVTCDITDRKSAEEELWRLANHDPLTGLPNRMLFQSRLEQALVNAKRQGTSVSLLVIDLDEFKDVNDSFGHDAGDALLKETASRLSAATRDGDTVARLGGDEFMVILAGSSLEHAATLAEGIARKLSQPVSYAGHMIASHASIGIASFPDHDAKPIELMKDADIALYRAKAEGRNRVMTFSPEMRAATEQRVTLRREMREAISLDQIQPFYQPKVCLSTGEIIGFEALARWQHPTRGLLTPGSFADAFDDPELATTVGKRLIGKVASDMRKWLNSSVSFGHVAINLSHVEFIQPGLAEDILRVLDLAKVPPKHFEIEITEKVLLDAQSGLVSSALEKFRARGVQIALDDFGTGYASLTHLKQFPVDHIKIDRSFVRDIEEDPDDEAIVTAVVSLGRSLNLRVTAEGVETTGQAQRLREMGCNTAQGYLYAKPMSGTDVPGLLAGWHPQQTSAKRLLLVEK